jgi:FAD/FMN-containing dehydrogenase
MTTMSQTTISISDLRAELGGQVIAPQDAEYDEARAIFYAKYDRRPAALARPANAGDVSRVVLLARESRIELAVRGGGHSTAGHSVSEGGVVLDLSPMNALELDLEARTAWVEAGATAGQVTDALGAHGLAIPFGDTGSVGIGGLTLGGGIGFLVRKHGLTIDQLLAAEIVTADGETVRADAETNPDLFWAIRGGRGNFGVVTRFQFRLQAVDQITGGMLLLPATPDAIASFVEAADAAPEELSAIANVMPAPPMPFVPGEHHGELVIMAMLAYAGPSEDGDRALEPFRSIATPIAALLRPMPYPEMFEPEEGDFRPLAVGRTLFLDEVDRGVAEDVLDHLRASTAQMPVAQLRVLGGALARVPDDATAFAHRTSGIMAAVAALYATPEEGPIHTRWADDGVARLRQTDAGAYVNFLGDEDEASVRAAYPGKTWDRLAELKRRYDPTNLFRLNQNIPPASAGS